MFYRNESYYSFLFALSLLVSLSSLFLALNVQMVFSFFPSPIFFLTALFTSLLFLVMTNFAKLTRRGIMKRVGFCNVFMHICQIQGSKRVNKTLQLLLKKMKPKLSNLIKWLQSVSFTKLNSSLPDCIVNN